MKKLLLIHNRYQNIGGEDIAVSQERDFLKKHYEIKEIIFDNSEIRTISQFFNFVFNSNIKSKRKVLKEIKEFNPDIAYVHNTWFTASLGIFKVLKSKNIKTILKLHNYRFYCTRSYLAKNHIENDFCMGCGLKRANMFVFNKYFKESYFKSFLVIRYGKKYFNIIKNFEGTVVSLTNFQENFLRNMGFTNNIKVIPNYLTAENDINNLSKSNNILYAGRISKEKGVEELINSFLDAKLININLDIIGDGPSYKYLVDRYGNFKNIKFLGPMSNKETLEFIAGCRAVVTATKLYEGQPTFLAEASLFGIPSIFPNTGGVSEFFPSDYPLMFEQFDYADLKNKLQLIENEKFVEQLGKLNKKYVDENFNEPQILKKFKDVI